MNQTEQEQIEEFKKWWSKSGSSIIIGVLLGASGIIGWQYWQSNNLVEAHSASDIYSRAIDTEGDNFTALEEQLKSKYSSTPYPAIAALLSAKSSVDENNLDAAANSLQWVIDNAKPIDIQRIAKLRLARVRLAQGNNIQALALLDEPFPESFSMLVEELKGDIWVAEDDLSKAMQAYTRALAAFDEEETGGNRQLLEMKLNDLAGESPS